MICINVLDMKPGAGLGCGNRHLMVHILEDMLMDQRPWLPTAPSPIRHHASSGGLRPSLVVGLTSCGRCRILGAIVARRGYDLSLRDRDGLAPIFRTLLLVVEVDHAR